MTRDADPTAERGPQPEGGSAEAAPLLRVVSPNATPEEIAALVTVFAALGSEPAPLRRTAPEWRSRHRTVRRTLPHGPGGWRSSGLPG
jgi:hypothetical protein